MEPETERTAAAVPAGGGGGEAAAGAEEAAATCNYNSAAAPGSTVGGAAAAGGRGGAAAEESMEAEGEEERGEEASSNRLCVAVDLGAQNSVVASCMWMMQQTATVECNALANRSTPSTVAFDGKIRLTGEEADAKASSNQLNTVSNVAMWLRVRSEEALKQLQQRLPFAAFPRCSFDSKGALQFEVTFNEKNVKVPFVLILAHYFKTLVGFATGADVGRASAVGLALPTSAADAADFAIASAAAALAGLPGFPPTVQPNSSSSNTEAEAGTAAAPPSVGGSLVITHADALLNCWCCRHLPQVFYDLREQLRQQQQQNEETAAASSSSSSDCGVLLLIVDAGYAETTVQVVELQERPAAAAEADATEEQQQQQKKTEKHEIAVQRIALGVESFGTVDMINALAQHVCRVIKQQHPSEPSIEPHSKRALRVFATCQRAVRDLSGLQDTSLSIDGFLQHENDFSCEVSRAEFEDLCAPLKTRLHALVQRALQQSRGRSAACIAGVEVVGGGSRVPWVQETLAAAIAAASSYSSSSADEQQQQRLLQQQLLRRTLDGSSSVAIGTALAAAGISSYILPLLENNRKLLQQQQMSAADLQAARTLGEEMAAVETAELRRCSMRNTLESYLLQMQSALQSGPHRELLLAADAAPAEQEQQQQEQEQQQQLNGGSRTEKKGAGWLRELLQTQEHWLLDHADAAEEEYRSRYENIKSELHARCPAYFEAVARAKQQKEAEMAAAAAESRANSGSSGDGAGSSASSLDRDMNIKLPNSQCIKRAKKNKDEGNEFFKGGNTEVAVQRYVLALQYVAKLFDMSPQDKAEADSIKLACNLNLAQAYLRLAAADAAAASNLLGRAVGCCDAALLVDPKSLKALYRRALSRERLRDFELALKDVQEGLALAPTDEDFLKLKDRLDKQLRLQKEKAKKMYAKMFA